MMQRSVLVLEKELTYLIQYSKKTCQKMLEEYQHL